MNRSDPHSLNNMAPQIYKKLNNGKTEKKRWIHKKKGRKKYRKT